MSLSRSSVLRVAASVIGTIFVAAGVNAVLRPDNALAFFYLPYPTAPAKKRVVDSLMAVYGVRDVSSWALPSTPQRTSATVARWVPSCLPRVLMMLFVRPMDRESGTIAGPLAWLR